jgi:hypothetical protein
MSTLAGIGNLADGVMGMQKSETDPLADLVRSQREQIDANRAELDRRGISLDVSNIKVSRAEGFAHPSTPVVKHEFASVARSPIDKPMFVPNASARSERAHDPDNVQFDMAVFANGPRWTKFAYEGPCVPAHRLRPAS